MKTTLIIMAAGIGSRFGTGIKQLAQMSPNGEIIMDYSIYDAKEAGFDKVVFIIRKDIEEEFRSVIGNRIGDQIEVEYVYQDLADIPAGFEVPEGRTKPWGTGQAVLCCKDVVKEPFVIINADDYYGKEAFKLLHDYLIAHAETADKMQMGMAGFILKNTVSENGIVTRGVCVVDENGMLCGDVNFGQFEDMVFMATPVPGGVGAVTTAVLAKHVLEAAKGRRALNSKGGKNGLSAD